MVLRPRSAAFHALVLGLFAPVVLAACSSSSSGGATSADSGVDTDPGDTGPTYVNPGSLDCSAGEADLYADPGDLTKYAVGQSIKCKDDGIVTAAQMKAALVAIVNTSTFTDGTTTTNTFQGRDPVSDTHVYRVLYKTTRAGGAPGFSIATMYLPVTPVAAKLPLVLVARGSRGEAPNCAPSRHRDAPLVSADNKDGNYVQSDYTSMVYPLAGYGFAVVATDNAGYSPFDFAKADNLAAGYAQVDDVARSYLDSARPLKAALGDKSADKLVLVGLSQGGHSALASLQVANTYQTPGPIVAVAAYSPLWYTQRSWGIALNPLSVSLANVLLNKSAGVPGTIWYHYTHAELLDGPGEGIKLFKPSMQAAVKKFVETVCWSDTYPELASALPAGAQGSAADFFSDAMNNALGTADLVFQKDCSASKDVPLCQKWLDRYHADHPLHTGAANDTPILIGYGLRDSTIQRSWFACVVEKLAQSRTPAQLGKVEYCINPDAGHGGSVLLESDYVNDWIKAKAFGTAAPAPNAKACPTTTWDASAYSCYNLLAND
jgi:hypothetical protein